jgi:branched-chain amino acid transport system ATP-binding protein
MRYNVNLLNLQNLSKSFDGIVALKEVDLDVESGMIHSLIGPNGAGKTTLFNIVSGILKPTQGCITYQSQRIETLGSDKITSLGIGRTFQNTRLFKSLTVLENVMVGRHCRTRAGLARAFFRLPFRELEEEKNIRDIAEELLRFMGLFDRKEDKAASLPYGSQRRLEIARALATEPLLLLLDEPSAGMDTHETEDLATLILKIRDQGITILLIEHDMHLVMEISDMVTVLNFGKRIAEGHPQKIQSSPVVIEAYLGT